HIALRHRRTRRDNVQASIFVAADPVWFEVLIRIERDDVYRDSLVSRGLQYPLVPPIFFRLEQSISDHKLSVNGCVSSVGQNDECAAGSGFGEFMPQGLFDCAVEVGTANLLRAN